MKKQIHLNYMDPESNELIVEIVRRAMCGVPLDTPIRKNGRIVPADELYRRGMVPAPNNGGDEPQRKSNV
jgi:hypothetical protein